MNISSRGLREKWMQTFFEAAKDPKGNYECPFCKHKYLDIKEEFAGDVRDIYLMCGNCGKGDVMTVKSIPS